MHSVSAPRICPGYRLISILLLLPLTLLPACNSPRAPELAARCGYSAEIVQGQPFQHQVFHAAGAGPLLHVYLEGDGRAWHTPRRPSLDPTPHNPLMLRLMQLDTSPSLYLGRPCHFTQSDSHCHPRWWTSHRYAPEVVHSINSAINRYAKNYRGVVLLGHSGGGALAMLLAAQRDDVCAVVTLAGNLDTQAWTQQHDYTPIDDSLNPASQPPLAARILQRHYLGTRDKRITPAMLNPVIARQPAAQLQLIDAADHDCCWQAHWSEILRRMRQDLAAADAPQKSCTRREP